MGLIHCPTCQGEGTLTNEDEDEVVCPECKGRGLNDGYIYDSEGFIITA